MTACATCTTKMAANMYVGPPYCRTEMYAGGVACCPLASHGENVDETDRRSGVARIWCQEGHMQKLLGFTGGNCRHIVAVRLCTGQSARKRINCCKSRGARAPVPHNWQRQWTDGQTTDIRPLHYVHR